MKKETEQYWSMTEGVFNCLIDYNRSIAFKRAIKNTVREGDVVVDMGTGSGILAMFAVDAGASKVYGIEKDEKNISTLRKTFSENQYLNKIKIIRGDVTKVKIPEKADVIIGEMIATALIEELQVLANNNILKQAKKNCKVLLENYDTYLDLVFNNENYYGHKFKIVRYEYPDLKKLASVNYSDQVLIDSSNFKKIRKNLNINAKIELTIKKSGLINGLRLSGRTIFHDKSSFGSSFAYDYPIILPLPDMNVKKGERYTVKISYKICGGLGSLKYSIT